MNDPEISMFIKKFGNLGLGILICLSACQKPPSSQTTPPENTSQSASVTSNSTSPVANVSETDMARIKTLGAPLDQADYNNGKAQFVKCRSCHTISPEGMNSTGPSLYDVYGRKVASLESYNYSDAMKSHKGVWDYPSLDSYITKPNAMVKGTKMAFAGIKKPEDRRDLIAYLALQSPDPKNP